MLTRLLTAIAAGVLIGILVAPDKGTASRKKIVDGGKDLGNRLNNILSDLKGKVLRQNVVVDDYAPETNGHF
jgi:hypothetical protein